jgi:hypothetical protein
MLRGGKREQPAIPAIRAATIRKMLHFIKDWALLERSILFIFDLQGLTWMGCRLRKRYVSPLRIFRI